MSNNLIYSLLGLSAACSFVLVARLFTAIWLFFKRNFFKRTVRAGKHHRSFKYRLLLNTLFLMTAIWCLRFAVGCYGTSLSVGGWFEKIFDSFVQTLQTFSLDEAYADRITAGRAMMNAVFGTEFAWAEVYGIYASVLNFLAPVAGGAILFEVLSAFSPKLRLFVFNRLWWTKKYYFSELNDNSLALAKSIVSKEGRNICLIFTDVYTDESEESGTERLAEAKALGAICLKDDLLHIRLHSKSPKIFLIDKAENSNLQALTALLERSGRKIKRSEIYVFSSDEGYSQLDEEAAFIVNGARLASAAPSAADAKGGLPTVIPVNGVRNMVTNLFIDVPLFEPLIDKQPDESGKRTLTVTILGSGVIGTELFLTTYWCGQMLDCELHINVVSKEKESKESTYKGKGDFKGRINHINPDIFKTKEPNSDLLKYAEGEEPAEPYFTFRYKESDVTSDDFNALMQDTELLDTDYFIVALGSDEENFAVANRLRQIIGVHHLYRAPQRKTVISYVIYNSELCRALNRSEKRKYSVASTSYDIFMHAFGCLEDVYSVKNVFFEGQAEGANDMHKSFARQVRQTGDASGKKTPEEKNGMFQDIYSYQASLARRFHRRYREFSAGYHTTSIFTSDKNKKDKKSGKTGYDKIEESYLKFVAGQEKKEEDLELLHKLAWLEHRRWCAFMRTKGFRCLDPKKDERHELYCFYTYQSLPEHPVPDHKFVALKLHPCLVERSKKGMHAKFDAYGYIEEGSGLSDQNQNDRLDELSRICKAINPQRGNFKEWDYPEKELSEAENAIYKIRPKQGKKRFRRLFRRKKDGNAKAKA